jgi:hypothetical protein
VTKIGTALGVAARGRPTRISAPLLGSGSGDLSPLQSIASLERGFLGTAPKSAVLTISIPHPDVLRELMRDHPLPLRNSDPLTLFDGKAGDPGKPPRRVAVRQPRAPAPPPDVTPPKPAGKPRAGFARTRIFISYSRRDAKWLDRLKPHLAHLQREGLIWSDRDIEPGDDWLSEIQENLKSAKVALLLISANYLGSKFIVENELPPLLEAADKEGTVILPVILSASRFDVTPGLSRFQAVNDPKQPLMKFRGNRLQEELDKISRAVEAALKR